MAGANTVHIDSLHLPGIVRMMSIAGPKMNIFVAEGYRGTSTFIHLELWVSRLLDCKYHYFTPWYVGSWTTTWGAAVFKKSVIMQYI